MQHWDDSFHFSDFRWGNPKSLEQLLLFEICAKAVDRVVTHNLYLAKYGQNKNFFKEVVAMNSRASWYFV